MDITLKELGGRSYRDEWYVVVIGAPSVGKTSSVIQYTQNHFLEDKMDAFDHHEDPIRKVTTLYVPPKQTEVIGWISMFDYNSENTLHNFRSAQQEYLARSSGIMLMYSVTSRRSFDAIESLRQSVLQVRDPGYIPPVFSLVGNKCDDTNARQVSEEEGKELADVLQCPFFECSAKTRTNIEDAFKGLAIQIQKAREEGPHIPPQPKSHDKKCLLM